MLDPQCSDGVDMIGTTILPSVSVTQASWRGSTAFKYRLQNSVSASFALHAFMILASANTSSRGGALEPVQADHHSRMHCSWRRVVFLCWDPTRHFPIIVTCSGLEDVVIGGWTSNGLLPPHVVVENILPSRRSKMYCKHECKKEKKVGVYVTFFVLFVFAHAINTHTMTVITVLTKEKKEKKKNDDSAQ